MNENELVIANGILAVIASIGFLTLFFMLLWAMRTENGITGALALREFALFATFFWSVALLFDWFPNRALWLQTRFLTMAFLNITLFGLAVMLIIVRERNH